jgi:glycosyltransferase involved in cell wall biosynthesis
MSAVAEPLPAPTPAAPDSGEVELTIIMPCLNEALTLETCIRKAQGFLQKSGIRGEVVIGDNGSTDGSQEIARRCGARVVDVPVRGYGAALYGATLAARGRYVIMGDSDDSYDFSDLGPFVAELRAGHDLVMGNRFRGGIKPGAMPWKNKYIGNPILTAIGRLFFRCPAKDFHCGLRGYSVAAFRKMDLVTTGMEFASEMVIKATLLHLKIAEVPTTLSPDGRDRPPHLRPWRDGWRHLRFMCLYSPKWLFFYPGLLLMLVGGVGLAALLPGPLRVGGVTLDVSTMLYAAAAVLVGFQAVSFAVLAKGFAVTQGLLPSGEFVKRTVGTVRTEFGIFAGLGLFLAGLAGSVVALLGWGEKSFGDLDPGQTLRVVIPSVLGLLLGGQTLLASFFLDVMRLHLRARPAATGSGV